MTRQEAEREAARLRAEDAEREAYLFAARERDGGEWEVVRTPAPGRRDYEAGVAAGPEKPHPGQPEPPQEPRPYWGGG